MIRSEDSSKWIVGYNHDGLPGFDPVEDNDGVMYFDSLEDVISVMRAGGATDMDLLLARTAKSVGICKRCGHPLFESFINGYMVQCFHCDEDFYSFEQEVID